MKKLAIRFAIFVLCTAIGIAIFALGVRVGHQWAYRDEHHLSQALLHELNQTVIEEDVRGFLINRFYYSGLFCPKGYAQGLYHDHGVSSSKAPKGKWFADGSNQELYGEYLMRASNEYYTGNNR